MVAPEWTPSMRSRAGTMSASLEALSTIRNGSDALLVGANVSRC
jgi:hypothetical protein